MGDLREKFKRKWLRVEMPDGSKYDVPVMAIATNRSTYYAGEGECGGDVERHLGHDTLPLFDGDEDEISDWAANNMNWGEVAEVAVRVEDSDEVDFEEGWANGDKEIVEHEDGPGEIKE